MQVIFDLLELEMTELVHQRINGLRQRAGKLNQNRQSYLNQNQTSEVSQATHSANFQQLQALNILAPR